MVAVARPVLLAALLGATPKAWAADGDPVAPPPAPTASAPADPQPGRPEDYAAPVDPAPFVEKAVFDKIRWSMTIDEIRNAYAGRTFWQPKNNLYSECLKWVEYYFEQAHFVWVCADEQRRPASILVSSEDALKPEWIQLLSERYGLEIPYQTPHFRHAAKITVGGHETDFLLSYENFPRQGKQLQNLTLKFVNLKRNASIEARKQEAMEKHRQEMLRKIKESQSPSSPPAP